MSSRGRQAWGPLIRDGRQCTPALVAPSLDGDGAIGYADRMATDPLARITQDTTVMGGRPCIRGLRVTVGTVVGMLAAGHSIDDVLALYPYLEKEDVLAALSYAAWRAEEVDVPLKAS